MEATEDAVAGIEVTKGAAILAAPPEDTVPTIAGDDNTPAPDVTADNDEDPFEVAFQARWELEQEKLRERLTAEARARIQAEQAAAEAERARTQTEQTLRDRFEEMVKAQREGLRSLTVYNEKGEASRISDEAIEQLVIKHGQAYNATVQREVEQRILTGLATTAVQSLPTDEARESFATKAQNKPLGDWLRAYAESLAPSTEYVKSLERELDVKIKAAEARGYAKGQKAPAGTPHAEGNRPAAAANNQVDLTTQFGLARALAQGHITDSEYRERRAKL